MFLIILSSLCLGVVLTLVVQIFFLRKLYYDQPEVSRPFVPQFSQYKLPKELVDAIKTPGADKKMESCVCLNLVFQFLFRELKDSKMVREWVIKKLTVEFDEMMASTPGKLLENITLRDFNLGSTFPIVKHVSMHNVKLSSDESAIEEVDILVDIIYGGGFQLAVDLDLLFNKTAYLCVTIASLSGPLRLRFSRVPYTHWSFSFCQDPKIEFKVKSQVGTRHVPQITSLIINQLRRSLRKKHTLPNYKIRYKPFFPKKSHLPTDVSQTMVALGRLKVTSIGCSRLFLASQNALLYCTLAVDKEAWIELSSDRRKLWVTHEFDVNVPEGQSVGMIFKTEFVVEKYAELPMVDTVIPNSPADLAGIKKNDFITFIDGMKVSSTRVAAKLIKAAKNKFTIRVERSTQFTSNNPRQTYCEDEPVLNSDTDSNLTTNNNQGEPAVIPIPTIELTSPSSEPCDSAPQANSDESKSRFEFISSKVKLFQKKKELDAVNPATRSLTNSPIHRRRSIGEGADVGPRERVRRKSAEGRILTNQQGIDQLQRPTTLTANGNQSGLTMSADDNNSIFDLRKTQLIKSCDYPMWNETFSFELNDKYKFLNVGIWARLPAVVDKQKRVIRHKRDILLGHTSVPLMEVALDCLNTKQGDTQLTFNLCPAQKSPPINKTKFRHLQPHSGFDPSLCYGDVTIAFMHTAKGGCPVVNGEVVSSTVDSSDLVDGNSVISKTGNNKDKHDFMAARFHSVTYCNFCRKKIWLKVAFQCRACAMICHNKCTERCQLETTCSKDAKATSFVKQPLSAKEASKKTSLPAAILNRLSRRRREMQMMQGEMSMTQDDATTHVPNITCEPPTPDDEMKSFQRPRSNSVPRNRLPPEGCIEDIPRTQSSSKLNELRSKQAQSEGKDGFDSDSSSEDEVNLIQYLKEQQKSQQTDELVVTAAKEMGKELFAHLVPEERRQKLDEMVGKFQQEIDEESENRAELAKLEREATTSERRRQVQAKVKNSDEKIQALALLMLHYCAGLQDCEDKMEAERQRLNKDEPWEFMDVNEMLDEGECSGIQDLSMPPEVDVRSTGDQSKTSQKGGSLRRRKVEKETDVEEELTCENKLEEFLHTTLNAENTGDY